MDRYQTEIRIAADRYVCLQLPPGLPEGRAVVTVQFLGTEPAEAAPAEPDGPEPDDHDVEWWEEFEDGPAHVG